MKITKIELFPVSLLYKRAFTMRQDVIPGAIGVVMKMHTDEGIVGISDSGGTSPWYQGETQDSMMGMIADFIAPSLLLDQDPTNIEKIMGRIDHVVRDNNQAKTLIDFALHDIKGKLYNVPVYQLLGGKCIDRIRLGIVLAASSPETVAKEAKAALKEGFTLLKLKTGQGSLQEDIDLVAAAREAAGPDVEMIVDVNGNWQYDQAITAIRALDCYNLKFIEQPLARWDIDGLARLRGRVHTPIYADEAAQEPSDLLEIIRKDAADGLMIKLSKVGGYLKSQRWVAIAQAAGLSVLCGCMAGSGIEAAAYSHLLIANEWLSRFPHENLGPLHTHDVLNTVDEPITDDTARQVPRYQGGYLYPVEGPGLGVELNEEVLARIITPGKAIRTVETKRAGLHPVSSAA
jgi:L-alanine-DL-glutamate epimerase-like enolase superfamily enzyme